MPTAPTGNPPAKNPLRGSVQIIPDRLFYCALEVPPPSSNVILRSTTSQTAVHFFSIDSELIYWNFFLDFGPLNLGQLYRFCHKLNTKLREESGVICFYSTTHPAKRANAIFLMCAWQILYMGRSVEEAYHGFAGTSAGQQSTLEASGSNSHSRPPKSPLTSVGSSTVGVLPPFHDASPYACTYDLTLLDCLHGLEKARLYGFFDFQTFDVEEYEFFEQVENGDLNWIIQDKVMAFAGPSYKKNISPDGNCTLSPAHYIPYFRKKNVALVVRLNKKAYDEQDFIRAGIDHLEQFYVDGSCPPMKILRKVISAFEAVPPKKAFAVHCKAGLGRTGTCIGAYMMKHYQFTAAEAIAWMRICRPGCVIGPQQHFLEELQPIMWQEGDAMRNKPSRGLRLLKTRQQRYGSSSTTDSPSRTTLVAPEALNDAVLGRAGQADSLLARRLENNKKHQGDAPGAVPITPDSATTKSTASPQWVTSA